jgi:hypothetical protein
MTDLSQFKIGLNETARQLNAFKGQARLTMSGFNWALMLLGIVEIIDQFDGMQRNQSSLELDLARLQRSVKAIKSPKKATKRKAAHKARKRK